MAFQFASAGTSAFGSIGGNSSNPHIKTGPTLEEIETESLGFQSIEGDSKVRLLPGPWPSVALPPPHASLLSVASNTGLLAAAGPDSVIIAKTESVREAYSAESSTAGAIKPSVPQLTLPLGIRVSQVAFSADESYLAISAETGGGLAIYDVQSILQGNTQSAFELSTNGISLRALTPNPTREKAELFAVVLANGQLMITNLKTRQFLNGPNGQVMKDGVSCVSWSNKGKQLVAGLGSGASFLMTPEGESKGDIPKPPNLEGDQHVSAISWLENLVFLMIHTPSSVSAGTALPSTYTLATRESLSSSTYTFQNLPGVCLPGGSGLERSPSSYFIQRLREFPPNIQDIIIVASTSSEDVGLFTRSKVSLANTADQALKQSTTSKFITTVIANDARRAELPMTEDMSIPTSAIGMAVDLSSKTKVLRPLPGEEMDFSPSPLPALMILNNEGVLVSWWIVYADSIRQGTAYPGLVELAGDQSSKPAQPTSSSQPAQSAFGQSAFGASTSIGAFGSTPKAGSSMLGSTSTPNTSSGAFGTPSGISSHQSPWGAGATGATSTFGKPSFGNSTAFGASNQGAAFGAPGGLGGRPSLWGSSSTATPTAPAAVFGQSGGLGMRSGSVFGASSNNSVFGTPSSTNTPSLGTGGGFSSFASAPGFAAASVAQGSGQSIFGKATPTASFTSAMDVGSSFGGSPAKSDEASGSSGLGGPFVLTSSWKNPNAGKDESSGPSQPASRSLFEGEFGATLEQAATKSSTQIKEAEMMSDDDHSGSPVSMTEPETTTPADTPAPSKFISTRPSTLHNNTQSKAMSTAVQDSIATTTPSGKLSEPAGTAPASISASTMFGKPSEPASTPQAGISASTMFGKPSGILSTPQANTPTIKSEPVETPIGVDKSLPEAPLPPDTVSKASYVPGDSSASSTAASKSSADDSLLASDFIKLEAKPTPKEMFFDDAPLPPDFTKSKAKPIAEGKIFDDAPLPPDFTKSKAKPAAEENIFDDAPLPLDFVKSKAKSKSEKSLLDDVPLRPDFLPQKAVSKDKKPAPEEQHALPEDSDTEGDDEEDLEAEQERGLNSEGSGIDVAQDLSPVSGEELSPKVSPESSFGTQSKSPLGGLFTKVGKPELQASKSLFGEVGKASAPIFPPPSNVQTSPRSPSPVRLPVPGHLRPDTSRSVSAPGVPHRAGISRKVTLGRPMPSKPPVQTIPQAKTKAKAPADRSRNEGFSHLSVQKKQREVEEVEEEQDLSDDEDERVREELASEIQPTLTLEPFLAHQDYVGNIDKPGLSGQIEKVYRDINSMIDTLGLNARSLQAFVKGHIEMSKENGRTREDLESDADWCLIEITDLVKIENSLQSILAQGRLQDVPGKQNTCKELRKELGKLQARTTEIKSVVGAKIDPTQIEALRTAPLSMEQSALRHDLRKKFTELQKLLADAEEGVSMLRAKLATQQGGKAGKAVPTVEAVHKTILTMTGMIEKKNEDIDILEQQMRKLGVVGNDDVRSREASPFMTPPTSARKGLRGSILRTPGSDAGAFYTPRSEFGGSVNGSARKKMADVVADVEERRRYGEKMRRRKEVCSSMKEVLTRGPIRVRPLNEV